MKGGDGIQTSAKEERVIERASERRRDDFADESIVNEKKGERAGGLGVSGLKDNEKRKCGDD